MAHGMDDEYTRNKKRAMEVALCYLGEQYRGRIEIVCGLPEAEKNCWFVYVPDEFLSAGSSRIVCMSKDTCTVFFDGTVGK